MQVIMFDRQSIFIHGMKISLQQHIPGISIQSVGQAEELWQKIESAPDALVMLDSGLDAEFCREVLQRIAQQFPEVKIIITAMDGSQKWLHESCNLTFRPWCHAILMPKPLSLRSMLSLAG